MRKVSLKVLIFASICALAALGGCLDPVNLTAFVQDPEVSEIIKKSQEKVTLKPDSEGNAGNKIITGLSNKYYMVKEWDGETDIFMSTRIVKTDGSRSRYENEIGSLTGGTIGNLVNSNIYSVRSAAPLPNGPLTYQTSGGSGTANVTGGKITLPKSSITLDVSSYRSASTAYNIVEVGTTASPLAGNNITLKAAGTTTDYVFVQGFNADVEFPDANGFYFLTVIIQDDQNINLTVTFSTVLDDPPTVIDYSYFQSIKTQLIINISNLSEYDSGSIIWYIDNGETFSTDSLTLDRSSNKYNIIGVYTITVTAKKGSLTYSAIIKITVNADP